MMRIHAGLAEIGHLGIEHALKFIEWRYEKIDDWYLPCHNTQHTLSVMGRAEKLARAMELSEAEIQTTKLIAAFHDSIWCWHPDFLEDGRVVRKPCWFNEATSLDELNRWIREQQIELCPEEGQLLECAVMATEVKWDHGSHTVLQPRLQRDSHPIVRCVALADLGSAGMDGALFANEGDLRFREQALDVLLAIKGSKNQSIPLHERQRFKKRMIEWSESQIVFASGRRALLETELGNLEGQARKNASQLFCKFDEAISSVQELVASRQDKDFWTIAMEMGYHIPS